jgi:hypothetical protein
MTSGSTARTNRDFLLRYRLVLGLFIAGLIGSGITAFPLEWELSILSKLLGITDSARYADMHGLQRWIAFVEFGLRETYSRFPFFGYASDWLAFGHLAIAAFFVLPLINPVRYRAVLQVGLVACAGVLVVALVCGPIRGIPFLWMLIDCSFGIIGAIPLLYCLRLTRKIEK